MRFLVTGATGLIGKKITEIILNRGDKLSVLTTNKKYITNSSISIDYYYWNPELGIIDENCMEDVDIVINLAGSPIAQLWTRKTKKSILESRVNSVNLLNNIILNDKKGQIKQFACASAIGIYPSNMDIEFCENSKSFSKLFLGETVREWEDSCVSIEKSNIKVLKFRIGIVLSMDGGLLKPIAILTKNFLGTWFGDGKNYYSWIHIDDIARSIIFLIDNNKEGIYNLVAPNPVNNKNFVLEIAKLYKTKVILPSIPKKIITFITGQMSELIMFNQKVSSKRLLSEGFEFKYVELKSALQNLLK
ncbi:MAG: TIGR01777 family oxidoreductase [Flavobacteriaceae bacterium]|jgi:uncharacterized protein (TIGR01777 family)|nr:TIGR01777 family oxidoreductase [Flavobacteriaceae bacterium]